MTTTRCRAKTFPCPAGDRCPQHQAIHNALEYSIKQADFNQYLELKNKLIPTKNAPASRTIHIEQPPYTPWISDNYRDQYTTFEKTWTKEQQSAVYYYTEADMHRRINAWLRRPGDNNPNTWHGLEQEVVNNLDTLTTSTYQRPNPQTPLWRAVSGKHANQAERYRIGQTITEDAYTSTTNEPAAVNAFVEDKHPVILQIFTKKGVPVSRRSESEYLLPRGMKFKVTAKTRANIDITGTIRARQYTNAVLITLHEIED